MTAVGYLLTHSTSEVVYRQPWRSNVCAAAGSAAGGKEKRCRSPSDRLCQDLTQTGRLACSLTGEVR